MCGIMITNPYTPTPNPQKIIKKEMLVIEHVYHTGFFDELLN